MVRHRAYTKVIARMPPASEKHTRRHSPDKPWDRHQCPRGAKGAPADIPRPTLGQTPVSTRRKRRALGHWCQSLCYPLMAPRNTALELVLPSLSNSSSIVSTGESGASTLRRIHTRLSSSLGRRSSSLRVPVLLRSEEHTSELQSL